MALLLYRIGRFSFRHARQVLVAWLLLLAAALGLGLSLGGHMNESFEIPGTESQQALDRLGEVFPQVAGLSAQVVVETTDGSPIAEHRGEITSVAKQIGTLPHVAQALDPYSEYATGTLSKDGQAALIQVQFDTEMLDVASGDKAEIVTIAKTLEQHNLRVEFGGTVYQDLHYGLTVTEAIGVAFAALVLIVTFGSVLAAGLPLVSALVGVGITMGVLLFVTRFIVVSSATPLLAVMIGIAVGIDYALFIVSRHRNQLANGMRAEESVATAVGTSGSAVTFAAATVMVALLGLVIVGIPFLTVMGIAAAGGVFAALLSSLTLLPALLGFAGERLRPKPGKRVWRRETQQEKKPTLGRRWARLVLKAPVVFVILVVGVLGGVAVPALHMQTSLPSGKNEAQGTTARDAYDIISEHFGEGTNGPLLVMLDITQMNNDTLLADLGKITDRIAQTPGVAQVGQALPNPTVDSAIVQVIPTTGPADARTTQTVANLRALADGIKHDFNATSSVTGATAVQIDITDRLNGALLPFAAVVVGLSFVLLALVFRSILVPLKAAVSFLLSAFAAFGVVVLVFQDGILGDFMGIVPGPIISFLPIILLAIVFGLAMDYEVFLVSGMREAHVRGLKPREAIEEGFASAARVVTAAALIMFFVFIAFVPEGAGVIKVIALGLAAGIAFDAFLVRMTLVPALMALFGKHAWWLPKWLRNHLPDLDIEGEQLRDYRKRAQWAHEHHAAIAFTGLQIGDKTTDIAEVSAEVAAGGTLLVRGEPAARSLFAATIAGRIRPCAGWLQVLGRTLPGDGGALISRVAIANIGDPNDRARELTLGQLIGRHGALGRQTLRSELPRDQVRVVIAELNAALVAAGCAQPQLTEATRVVQLDALGRAVALAGAAIVELPELLVLEVGGLGLGAEAEALLVRILVAVRQLLPEEVAVVITTGTTVSSVAFVEAGLDVTTIDLVRAAAHSGTARSGKGLDV